MAKEPPEMCAAKAVPELGERKTGFLPRSFPSELRITQCLREWVLTSKCSKPSPVFIEAHYLPWLNVTFNICKIVGKWGDNKDGGIRLSRISSVCPTGPLLVSLPSFLPQETDHYEIPQPMTMTPAPEWEGWGRVGYWRHWFTAHRVLSDCCVLQEALSTYLFPSGFSNFLPSSRPPGPQAQRWSHLRCYNPRVTALSLVNPYPCSHCVLLNSLFMKPSSNYLSLGVRLCFVGALMLP